MKIDIGKRLPEATLMQLGTAGVEKVDLPAYVAGRRVVIFCLPGAFTPTCTQKHLPSYVNKAEKIHEMGVDEIICIAVNDPFVMKAWGDMYQAEGRVTLLADPDASFAKAAGIVADMSDYGLGLRSQRCSMIVENGIVREMRVEAAQNDFAVSGADECIAILMR
jgi:peroxiredoxin